MRNVPVISYSIVDELPGPLWFSRAEKLVFRKWHGKMKLLGIVACAGGTMVVSLYKGKMLHHPWPTHLLRPRTHTAAAPAAHHDMVVSTLFLCGSCLGYAF